MANKVIKHYYNSDSDEPSVRLEPDKTKTISELSFPELRRMLERLRSEREVEDVIRDLKRRSGERDTYEEPFKINTKTPINQLYHYGIVGQKWGVRRYQNKDGTRTTAGKRREREDFKPTQSDDHTKSRESRNKGTSSLSNEELKKLNERLRLEDDYKRLSSSKVKKSESWVQKAIQSGGEQALSEFSKGVFLGGAKTLIKEVSPQFAETAFNIKEKKRN